MNALMLIFALTAGGPETLAMAFPSLAACEAAKPKASQLLADMNAMYIALACVVPVKVQGA